MELDKAAHVEELWVYTAEWNWKDGLEFGMQDKRYLLDIGQMLGGSGSDALLREAYGRIDAERREKALRIKNSRALASSIGAGLLIQKALADCANLRLAESQTDGRDVCLAEGQVYGRDVRLAESQTDGGDVRLAEGRAYGGDIRFMGDRGEHSGERLGGSQAYLMQERQIAIQHFSVEGLVEELGRGSVAEPCYQYGENGKPHFGNYPFRFNLSHSGRYVFCGVSGREIGVDIQEMQEGRELQLAKRFFSAAEYQWLEDCEEAVRRQLFFRLWVRKEAYGKLTGEGLAGVVGKNLGGDFLPKEKIPAGGSGKELLQRTGPGEHILDWEEYEMPKGYRIAVCRFVEKYQFKIPRSGIMED